ncbi:RNA polymerase Rpb4 family protein [Babesia bovis T2Bo]|uniref:RNA polymerase Rpb4 family protein n=1 Tax=Babesia bovis T2Bo TaxID=484906 RepID=UPI001C36CB3F|nr:RNA polymerase Rpb4 family protein [Babesia bovis T2Bo]KAG6440018.1 RNA polymerase Rpb4 family protein [Babesia bovis T2Bo]
MRTLNCRTSHEYASRFAILKFRSAIVDIRTTIEREGSLHEFEMASVVNLLPKSVDEAKSVILELLEGCTKNAILYTI